MTKLKLLLFILLSVLFLQISCSDQTKEKKDKVERKNIYYPPRVSDTIKSPDEQLNFIISCYWDFYNFNDTALIYNPDYAEQAFVDYIALLPKVKKKIAIEAIRGILKLAEKEKTGVTLRYFMELSEKYFYDPNSPMRNDEFYIPVVEFIIDSKHSILNLADKERAKFNLELLLKNRVGDKANNLFYTLATGENKSLYEIDAAYILLYFYNPDCFACKETTELMKSSSVLSELLHNSQLRILAYCTDSDYSVWEKNLKKYPKTWINGYDKNYTIRQESTYDLKASPTLYLLSRNKTVLLKDAPIEQIIDWLSQNALSPLVVN